MAINLNVTRANKTEYDAQLLLGVKGDTGKSAYQYAVDGGYEGSETDFLNEMARLTTSADEAAASAEAAQDALDEFVSVTATAETLPAGSDATASYSEGELTLGIPKGDKGDKGDTYDDSAIVARMDSFTQLAEGSTTGDAELIDGRVGADGVTYNNIGGAIRAQVTDLKSDLSSMSKAIDVVARKVSSPNLINFDDPDYATGKFMENGIIYNSNVYNTSGYIPVEEGKTYTFYHDTTSGYGTPTIRFLSAFDSSKNVILSACTSNVHSYTVPSGVAYIVISSHAEIFNLEKHAMLYEGTSIDKYYPYFAPYYVMRTDHNLTVKASADSIPSGNTLTVIQNVDCKKNHVIEFWGAFSAFTSLIVGHGGAIEYGNYAVIDDTNITVYYGANSQQIAQQAHGLTISDFIHVVISQNSEARAKIQITTASGEYTLQNRSWDACRGDVYVTVESAMTNCVCSSIYKDMAQDVFVFGDSYVGLTDSRYPYYLIRNEYDNFYLDGWGGRNSAQALASFNNVMGISVPKYAVWGLGMNDADSSSAVNASWLSCVQSFLATCEKNGITPILATIPNCPNQLNTFKNSWVKSSGYRYIDFAKAVGAEEQGSSWYAGMLYTDNVHPTTLGAKALYARFLTDVPEVIR